MKLCVPLAAATLMLTLFGCGGDGESAPETGSPSASKQNEADVTFATEMIQHHAQALQMVTMTLGRPLSAEVEGLAEDIRESQVPEVEQMSQWLTQWGQPVPETVLDHANAHGDGHGGDDGGDGDLGYGMPGMMTEEQITGLEDASDADFETMWLEMMIEHHQDAIPMAEQEKVAGKFRPAIRLATRIIKDQQAEIEAMTELLGQP